jgi:hypothetical protein
MTKRWFQIHPVCLSTFEGHVGGNGERAWPVDWFLRGLSKSKRNPESGWRTKNEELASSYFVVLE